MTYDLRTEPWIPWRRRRSGIVWGPISMLTDGLRGDDAVIATAAPRADFDGALQEFLVGMLTSAFSVVDDDAWREFWDNPPSPDQVQHKLNALPVAFDLDAETGPRFLQDFDPAALADQAVLPIDRLAIDSPGEQGIKFNKTLFVKAARFEVLSRPTAAMALITMQTYAPAGGQGNRTSMRGGGPLTTLADPRQNTSAAHADEQPLWEKLWMNVETTEHWRARASDSDARTLSSKFAWMGPTKSSDAKKPPITPQQAHSLQAYFGMPRRIRLEFGAAGTCGITARSDERCVIGFRMRNYGVEYAGWKHPLSPYRNDKGEWLPLHPQPGGIGWKDWPDLALQTSTADREAATVILRANARANELGLREIRLHAFGFDMDNMKARAWISSLQPLLILNDDSPKAREWLGLLARSLVDATRTTASSLSLAIKNALYDRIEDAGNDDVVPRQRLWSSTETQFFDTLRRVAAQGLELESVSEARRAFHEPLRNKALQLFDEFCAIESAPVTALRRHVTARHGLVVTMNGYGKFGRQLFELLNLPPREVSAAAKKKATSKKGAKV